MTTRHLRPQPDPGGRASDYRVSVTVFVTAEGRDALDAGHVAELAVQRALPAGETVTVRTYAGYPRVVHVSGSIDTATAAANGYFAVSPSTVAYQDMG
jgi:hypothetical protein